MEIKFVVNSVCNCADGTQGVELFYSKEDEPTEHLGTLWLVLEKEEDKKFFNPGKKVTVSIQP